MIRHQVGMKTGGTENISHNLRIISGDYAMYLRGKSDWPAFTRDKRSLTKLLAVVSKEQRRLLEKMEALGFKLRSEAHLHILTEDMIKSSEIEGEKREREQVRSSIARRLGMNGGS